MIAKVFKGVWFLSLLVTMAVFFYVYASLPETITLGEGNSVDSISRNGLFYSILALVTVFNMLVMAISRLYAESSIFFRAWFYGLITFLNMFIIVVLQFVNVFNSSEKFDYANIGYIVYGSIGLMVLWSSLWPLFSILNKITKAVAAKE